MGEIFSSDLYRYEIAWQNEETVAVFDVFGNLRLLNIRFGVRAFVIVAGAITESRLGSGSTKMMRLHASPAPQHCFVETTLMSI
jgi:hypothetical protein